MTQEDFWFQQPKVWHVIYCWSRTIMSWWDSILTALCLIHALPQSCHVQLGSTRKQLFRSKSFPLSILDCSPSCHQEFSSGKNSPSISQLTMGLSLIIPTYHGDPWRFSSFSPWKTAQFFASSEAPSDSCRLSRSRRCCCPCCKISWKRQVENAKDGMIEN